MAPQQFPGDDFDLDIKVVSPEGPQPVRAVDTTERCTARYGYYTCGCYTVQVYCKTIAYCGSPPSSRAPRCG
jgi:hypothetical protein